MTSIYFNTRGMICTINASTEQYNDATHPHSINDALILENHFFPHQLITYNQRIWCIFQITNEKERRKRIKNHVIGILNTEPTPTPFRFETAGKKELKKREKYRAFV